MILSIDNPDDTFFVRKSDGMTCFSSDRESPERLSYRVVNFKVKNHFEKHFRCNFLLLLKSLTISDDLRLDARMIP